MKITTPAKLSREDKIDRFGDLDRALALIQPEHTALKEELRSWLDAETPAAELATARGKRWFVLFSPRKEQRTVTNKVKAFKLAQKTIGLNALIELLTIPLAEVVDKLIPKSEHGAILTKDRSGTRELRDVIPALALDQAAGPVLVPPTPPTADKAA